MKIPRDITGQELAALLDKYGYKITRQTGSHMRLTSNIEGHEHHLTIPHGKPLKVGTLQGILREVASYKQIEKNKLAAELFGK